MRFHVTHEFLRRYCRTLEGESWLAYGTAAIGFDPICGDATAHAIREAILVSAVIRAFSSGAQKDDVLPHYESRLIAGFQGHLENCAGFYCSGGSNEWWKAELDAAERGTTWCAERIAGFPAFRYRLNEFELGAVA